MAVMSVPSVAPLRGALNALGEISPTREEFRELARERRVVPVTRRLLADSLTPVALYATLAGDRPGTFLLESAENGHSWSRWSFVGVAAPSALTERDGVAYWLGEVPAGLPTGGDPLQVLSETLRLLHTEPLAGLPPLTGGMVGYLGYDIVRRLERIGGADGAGGAVDELRRARTGDAAGHRPGGAGSPRGHGDADRERRELGQQRRAGGRRLRLGGGPDHGDE